MTTIADYAGKTVDVAAFQGWEQGIGVEVLLGQSLADDVNLGGEVVTGVIKLIQRFLIVLLTERGSLKYLADSGCTFMIDARRGRWRTSADVQQSFYAAMLDVRRQMRQMELASDPAEERLSDVKILSILLSPRDKATLRLLMTTQAGNARTFLAPISISPG